MSNHGGWGTSRHKRINQCGHAERRHYAGGFCKECYRRQPEILAKRHRYYLDNKAQFQAHSRKSTERRIKQRKTYGLTTEQWYAMLSAQGGTCAICGQPPKRKQLCVDHCHETGRIRSLLCHSCNGGLGYFKDKPELLARAIAYLDHYRDNHSLFTEGCAKDGPPSD